MSWADVGGLLTGVATAVAAVLVIFQLGELNKQAKLAHFSDYTQRFNDIVMLLPEDAMRQDFALAGRADYEQVMRALRRYFDLCFEEWYLGQRGLIGKDIWALWESGIRAGCGKPAIHQAWAIIRNDTTFDPKFVAFIEALIAARLGPREVS